MTKERKATMTKEIKTTKTTDQKPIERYEHKDKHRLNNPPVGLVDAHTDNGGADCSIFLS